MLVQLLNLGCRLPTRPPVVLLLKDTADAGLKVMRAGSLRVADRRSARPARADRSMDVTKADRFSPRLFAKRKDVSLLD